MADDVPQELINAARSRWRADLLRLHADELDASAEGATDLIAGQLTQDATSKRAEAHLHEAAADMDERYVSTLAALHAGDITRAEWGAFADEITATTRYWRQIGETTGQRGRMAIDHFPEPTDADLAEGITR